MPFAPQIDSLGAARGDSESEAARRIKTQLLIEITAAKEGTERVLVLGATNLPYMLDNALRRRFDKVKGWPCSGNSSHSL